MTCYFGLKSSCHKCLVLIIFFNLLKSEKTFFILKWVKILSSLPIKLVINSPRVQNSVHYPYLFWVKKGSIKPHEFKFE
jgi:hypothetical protein